MRKKSNWNDPFLLLPIMVVSVVMVYQISYLINISIFQVPDRSLLKYKEAYDRINNSTYNYPTHKLQIGDYHRLVNQSFEFKIMNSNRCNSSIFILILVNSSPKNFARRRLIRRTWGKRNGRALILFALGSVVKPELQKRIERENSMYKDLIQGSFRESFKNTTYKNVMMFKYAIYHCAHAKYMLKTDEDVFINVEGLITFLDKKISSKGAINFLLCLPPNERVIRSFIGGYPRKRKPKKRHISTYIGMFLVYSKNVIFEFYAYAQSSKFTWMDDSHISGYFFKKLRFHHVNAKPYMVPRKDLVKVINRDGDVTYPFFFSGPDLSYYEMEWLDGYLKNRSRIVIK
ncbi:beta-1,3-galactosyltransferase 1-like [Harmonia axyridis]|uniref:beta-1,3-galactosyltransferase 1-like n=1 Tax=Harmonia axyridis TaxID=115357 RepID=UPI001E277277|nr:beta-1,3-galactosyltransferase 1-like [Harmonia axyridis]